MLRSLGRERAARSMEGRYFVPVDITAKRKSVFSIDALFGDKVLQMPARHISICAIKPFLGERTPAFTNQQPIPAQSRLSEPMLLRPHRKKFSNTSESIDCSMWFNVPYTLTYEASSTHLSM